MSFCFLIRKLKLKTDAQHSENKCLPCWRVTRWHRQPLFKNSCHLSPSYLILVWFPENAVRFSNSWKEEQFIIFKKILYFFLFFKIVIICFCFSIGFLFSLILGSFLSFLAPQHQSQRIFMTSRLVWCLRENHWSGSSSHWLCCIQEEHLQE